jgi:hypothetical protein
MDVFAAAIDDLFADPNVARAAIWRAGGVGDGVPVRIITRRPDSIAEFGATRLAVETTLFDLRVSEVPDLAEGDTLDLDGEMFVVQGEPRRDAARLVWTAEARPAG